MCRRLVALIGALLLALGGPASAGIVGSPTITPFWDGVSFGPNMTEFGSVDWIVHEGDAAAFTGGT